MTGSIWLTGNKGMLGTELSMLLEKASLPFTGTDRETDITDPAALDAFIRGEGRSFAWIVNCAAYTAVDKAEDDVDACRRLNAGGPANIAACAKKTGGRLIHISTDYVFDGRGTRPYTEDDPADPVSVYGLTKREGEAAALEGNFRTYVMRTAWLYGGYGGSFVQSMLRLMNERDEVRVLNDQKGTPTWVFDLASVIVDLIKAVEAGNNVPFGIYHYTNEGSVTWFDFAGEIYRRGRELGLIAKECAVKACTGGEYPLRAKRPAYSVLDKTKIRAALGIDIPAWDKSLRKYLESL